MTNIWSTIVHITEGQSAHLGFEVCSSLQDKTSQIWMVKRLVGNIDDLIYESYGIIKGSSESYLVFLTLDSNNIDEKKISYLASICKAFKKKLFTFSLDGGDLNSKNIEKNGGHIIKCNKCPDADVIADGVIDLHCNGRLWRTT